MPENGHQLLLTVPEAARCLALGKTKVWNLVYAGELRTVRIGRSVRIPRAQLERYVEALQEATGG